MTRTGILVALAVACGCGSAAKSGGARRGTNVTDDDRVREFHGALKALRPEFRACHERARVKDYRVSGQLSLEIVAAPRPGAVTGAGPVARARVVANKTGSEDLAQCIERKLAAHEWHGALRLGDAYRTPLAFPSLGPKIVVTAEDVVPEVVSESLSIATLLSKKNSDNADASLSLISLSADLPLRKHNSTELLFVLSGEGTLFDRRGKRKRMNVSAGSAVYIPSGAPHRYKHRGKEPLIALVAHAPAGAATGAVDSEAAGTELLKNKRKWPKGTPRVQVRATGKVRAVKMFGKQGEARILLDKRQKATVSMSAVTLYAGAAVPAHSHEDSTEVLYILEGGGTLVVGDSMREVRAGSAISIPRGSTHSFQGMDGTATKALQMYVPGGPEQRFRKGGGK